MAPQALVLDQATGLKESPGNYAIAFTAERKEEFLNIYRASGLKFYNTCRSLGISHHTVNHHFAEDKEFKERFKQIQAEYAEELEAKQRDFAMEKSCFMDRAMQLRALLPSKYARDERQQSDQISITIQGDLVIDAKKRIESLKEIVVDNVVDNSANFDQAPKQVANNASIQDVSESA